MLLLFCISLLTSYLDAISKSHGTLKLWSEVQGRKRNEGAVGDYEQQKSKKKTTTSCSIRNFTNSVTLFSLATCGVHHFQSNNRSI